MNRKRTLKPKDLVKWNSKNEALIARYVQAFMDILVIDANGKAKTTESFKLEAYLKILSQNVELHDITTPEIKRSLIFRAAFVRLKKYKTQNIHTFRQALAAEVRQHLGRPVQRYWVLFPLQVAPEQFDKFRSFSILGTKLTVRDWKYIRRHFKLEKFLKDTERQLLGVTISLETDFTPIMILTEVQDPRQAIDQANRIFDLFRWLLNLLSQFNIMTRQWGGYPRPLGKILPSPVYGIFKHDGEYEEFFYNLTKYPEYSRNTIPVEQIVDARKLANRLRTPKNEDDTVLLIVEALEKYGQALDTTEWRLAFLVLWQILELLTLQSSEQFNMKSVVNRINSLLKQDQLAKDLLLALYETRNALVHLGHFPDEQGLREVNLLKYIVERSINAIFAHLKYLPTKSSLARFYEYASARNSDLADRQRVITYIRRYRT